MSKSKTSIDELEIEPLSDADLANIAGANSGADPSCSCRRCSCSTDFCSSAGDDDLPLLELRRLS
ncbi:MAG: hypothetical protein AAF772_04360 [Acidobacteriota bacterium]